MRYPKAWRAVGGSAFGTCLHRPVVVNGTLSAFALDVAFYIHQPGEQQRRLVHRFDNLSDAEEFLKTVTGHVEEWRKGESDGRTA